MTKFKVSIEFEKEIEAKDREMAVEKFWEEVEEENASMNQTMLVRLSENMEIDMIEDEVEQ